MMESSKLSNFFLRRQHPIEISRGIEHMCKKGLREENQDNMFILVDHDTKIFALCDGHGDDGHRVSGFVCARLLNYIRNKSNGFFKKKNLMSKHTTKEDIERNVKRAFKSIQSDLKAMYLQRLRKTTANKDII
jgi:serine/threonine protein phosphatase PrpC